MDLSLFFAGTGGSVPSARRGLPALLLARGGERLLFDCGEGTQRQLVSSIGLPDLDEIFLTHFHTDHWLGLPGLLKTLDLRGRDRPLIVHGPRGLAELIGSLRRAYGRLSYELTLDELGPGEVRERAGYRVEALAVSHRVTAIGYAILESPRPGRFDADLAARLGVTPGPDFGRLQRGEPIAGVAPERVIGPERPGRKIVITGDTEPCAAVELAARGADVLVSEATFLQEDLERAEETAHSTAQGSAALAARADVRLLALTHLSMRYSAAQVRDEARAVFGKTVVPHDFDTITIPFPERGEPGVLRFSERREIEA